MSNITYMIIHNDSNSMIADSLESFEKAQEQVTEFAREDVIDQLAKDLKEARTFYSILPE